MSRVLVAVDESPQARAALRHALEKYADDEIVVLHATDPQEWVYWDEFGGYYDESALDRAEERAEAVLAEAERVASEGGVTIETATATGRPADAIVDYAAAHDIDHIVVGSHGRRGLTRFLLGSVAEGVVKRAHESVTVIREEATETLVDEDAVTDAAE